MNRKISRSAALASQSAKTSSAQGLDALAEPDSTHTWEEPEFHGAPSKLSRRLSDDAKLAFRLQRDVCAEVAAQLIRLRKFREMTQEELGKKVGTSQSAIARHERAVSNMRLNTLEGLLEGLDAVIRVDLIPQEHNYLLWNAPRWYVAVDGLRRSLSGTYRWTCEMRGAAETIVFDSAPAESVQYQFLTGGAADINLTQALVSFDEPQEIEWQKLTK